MVTREKMDVSRLVGIGLSFFRRFIVAQRTNWNHPCRRRRGGIPALESAYTATHFTFPAVGNTPHRRSSRSLVLGGKCDDARRVRAGVSLAAQFPAWPGWRRTIGQPHAPLVVLLRAAWLRLAPVVYAASLGRLALLALSSVAGK